MTPKEAEVLKYLHYLNDPKIATLVGIVAIWVVIWKGLALWKAARNNSKAWYIALLVINTLGILEIIYFFFFSKKKEQ